MMTPSHSAPMRTHLWFPLVALVLLVVSWASGCARVQPWERDMLADPRMQPDANSVETSIDDHIYFSKEASSGGRGFGGGGCGCN
jgi:hypothetical protein